MPEKSKLSINLLQTVCMMAACFLLFVLGMLRGGDLIGTFSLFLSLPALLFLMGSLSLSQPFALYVRQRIKMEQAFFALRIFRTLLLIMGILHAVIGAALFFFSPWIAEHLLKMPLLMLPVRFSGIALFLLSLMFIVSGFLQGMGLSRYAKQGTVVLWGFSALFSVVFVFLLGPIGQGVGVFMRNPLYGEIYMTAGMELGITAGCLIAFGYYLVVMLLVIRQNDAYFDDLPRQDVPTGNFFLSIPSCVLTVILKYGFFFLNILMLSLSGGEGLYSALGRFMLTAFLPVFILSLGFSRLPLRNLRAIQLQFRGRERAEARRTLQKSLRSLYQLVCPVALYLFAAAPALISLFFGDQGGFDPLPLQILSFTLLFYPLLPFLDSFLEQGGRGGPIFLAGAAALFAELILLKLLSDRGVSPETALAGALLLFIALRALIEALLVFRMIRMRAGAVRVLAMPFLVSAVLGLVVFLLVGNLPLPALALVIISLILMGGGYIGVFYLKRAKGLRI